MNKLNDNEVFALICKANFQPLTEEDRDAFAGAGPKAEIDWGKDGSPIIVKDEDRYELYDDLEVVAIVTISRTNY